MTNKPELLPCPFCKQQDAFVEQLDSDASVVICQGSVGEHEACLCRGPVGVQQSDDEDQPGHDEAVRLWNLRAAPAEDVRAVVEAPYGYLREVDGHCQLSIGPISPPDRASGYATPWCAIYSHPQRPVVLPERKSLESTGEFFYEARGWNACLDAVEELNK